MNSNTFTKVVTITILAYMLLTKANAQQIINTPCTASMIATFTPCLNYITGSTANGTSPSSNCCYAFKSLMSSSMDCACLLVTAGIPLQIGNRTLALGLPRFCKGVNVPVQCQGSASPLSAPGPLQIGAPAPSSAFSPQGPQQFGAPSPSSAFSPQGASKATTAATPMSDQPTPTQTPAPEQLPADAPQFQLAAPSTTPGIRPVFVSPPPSSPSIINMPTIWPILLGFILFNL